MVDSRYGRDGPGSEAARALQEARSTLTRQNKKPTQPPTPTIQRNTGTYHSHEGGGSMWNSAPLLAAIAWWSLVLTAVFGGLAVITGLVGGVAANRASDIGNKEANAKIAEANVRAEEARLETARIWGQVAWRRVSDEQARVLTDTLRGENFAVWTSFVGDDPEATIFRNELDAALRRAGLETKYFAGWTVADGLKIVGKPSPERNKLIAAFQAAGFQFDLQPPGEFSPDDLVIIVGTKPEPVRVIDSVDNAAGGES